MPKVIYTQEMIDFLKYRINEINFNDMTNDFNIHFNMQKLLLRSDHYVNILKYIDRNILMK